MGSALTAKQKLRRAFDQHYDRHPFIASIITNWSEDMGTLIATNRVPTAATDGVKLYYNPAFVDSLNVAETVDLVLHEAMHIFNSHHLRFGDKPAAEWNVAADAAGNDYLKEFYTPEGLIRREGIFPGEGRNPIIAALPKGKEAEYYFRELSKKSKPEQDKDQDQEGGDDEQDDEAQGSSAGSAAGDASDGAGDARNKPKPSESDKESDAAEVSGGTGKGTGDEDGPVGMGGSNPRPDLPQSVGEILPHPSSNGTEEEKAEAVREWEQQVATGIAEAKARGLLPGWIEQLGESLYAKESKVNWKLALRRFLTKFAPVGGFTYSMPNRRHSWNTKIIMPIRRSKQASDGCLLTDTSGSMQVPEMELGLSEIGHILTAFDKCKVTMRMCDTRLIEDERVFTAYDFPIWIPQTWKGRGGTNLSPAIAEIGKSRKFKWLIVLTDGEWPMDQCVNPGIPVLWLCTRELRSKPKFGHVITVQV